MKRVVIIGAGPCGLSAIKCCLDEGLSPTCLERGGEAGGLWAFCEEDTEGMSSVMRHTIMNTGKELTAFSNFPPPSHFPNYMHHSQTREYLLMYAEAFDLLRYVRFHSEVVQVEPADDYDEKGGWRVHVRNTQTGETRRLDCDAVMVCIGHHVYPNIPNFPGQERFRGTIRHSQSVKDCYQFRGRKVLVVGLGNSGGDIAVDSSFEAQKVYLSTRRGSWIHSRIGPNGRPLDMDYVSREKILLRPFTSFESLCDAIEGQLNQRFDHEAYKLKPKHRVLNAHPTLNDFLPYCIVSGRVIVKGDIERFEEKGVVFAGEDVVTEIDAVVLATGYLIRFPFLVNVVETEDNRVELYKYVIPPHLKHPTLGIIGLVQPVGSIAPVAEMQSRWFTRVLQGRVQLPSLKDMLYDIKVKRIFNERTFVDSSRHTIQVNWIPFMDELAEDIGAMPNMWQMAFADPELFRACFFGPCLPYQYRLQGPHTWSGARDALLSYEQRVFTPLNGNKKVIPKDMSRSKTFSGVPCLFSTGIDIAVTSLIILYSLATFCIYFTINACKRKIWNIFK